MSSLLAFLILLGAFVGLAAAAIAWIRYSLLRGEKARLDAFTRLDLQLKRRRDLALELAANAENFSIRDASIVNAMTAAALRAVQAAESVGGDPSQMMALRRQISEEALLTAVLDRMARFVLRSPNPKVDAAAPDSTDRLIRVEIELARARRAFNEATAAFNRTRELFPFVLLADLFGFRRAELWPAEDVTAHVSPPSEFRVDDLP
jgi:LemA protein